MSRAADPHRRADVRFATIAVRTGVRLHYAETGATGRDPVLLLHGYTDSWYSFSAVLPSLAADFHVFALDQRGHGDSERPPGGYAIADLAADAAAFLDAVRARRAVVVGHSMGALVAQRMAIEHPDRVAKLVLVGSCTNAMNEPILALREEVRTLADPVPQDFVRAFQASTAHRPLAEPFLEAVVAQSRKVPARVWRDLLDGILAEDCADRLCRVRAPTLILWGDRDTVFGRAEQDRLCAAIPSARLCIYPDTGHALHWEQPERFVADLQAFMSSGSL